MSKEQVEELTTINFSVTKCPLKIFKEFSDYCKKETNDNYAFGMKMLLDCMKGNLKELMLYEQYTELRDRVVKLEEKNEDKKPPKTMGAGGNEK